MKKTPINDQDTKIDLISHINQDHKEELLDIVRAFSSHSEVNHPQLIDLFEEGAEISVRCSNVDNDKLTVFVPFQIKGDVEEKFLYLAYSAMAKQGKPLNDSRRQFFEIIQIQQLTPHILRLTIMSDKLLPECSPAYAYGFLLKVFEQQPQHVLAKSANKYSHWQRFTHLALLWIMKKLSSKNRQKVIREMNKSIRYYTLQKAWQEDAAGCNMGCVDIFLHDDTAGSQWAASLKKGDVISSRVEHEDNHENLYTGQALLIADETGYPALLGLLEHWQQSTAPYIIIVSSDVRDQAYFNQATLQKTTQAVFITCPPEQQAKKIIEAIASLPKFTTTWGALEKSASKKIRVHLRNHYQITGKDNRIKAYWVR